MRAQRRRVLVTLTAAALLLAACGGGESAETAGGGATEGATATEEATRAEVDVTAQATALEEANYGQIAEALTSAEAEGDLPFSGTLRDGSPFQLAERIASKVRGGQEVNYVFSYQSSGIPLFSDQYRIGYETTLPIATEIYPLRGTSIAPATDIDIPQQLSQIEALLNTEQIDCLTIEPPDSDAFTAITNQALSQGIPVFTVGVTSNGNEFTNFTQIPEEEGRTAAEVVLEQLEGNDIAVATVSGGDPTAFWAQGRMSGFVDGVSEALPDVEFLNTAEDPLDVTFDPAQTYDAYQALISGQPDLDFILNVDIGAEHAARAISDAGRQGEIFTAGWNVSQAQLDAIDNGLQVAAFDQRWSEQAGFGAVACATFFATGQVLPNTQQLLPITTDNVDEARADLEEILGGG